MSPGAARIFRAVRHPNFRLYMLGQLVSWTGSWIHRTAQAWLVYKLTHSAALLGAVGFASQAPALLLGPLAGVYVDHHHRWRIVVLTQTLSMASAFTLALLTFAGAVNVWHIVLLAFALGCIDSFDIPARQAFMGEMVAREDLMNAIALNSSTFNAARLLGPAVAGFLVAAAGEGTCFFLNGLSYLAVLASLMRMRNLSPPAPPASMRLLEQMLEGFRFARDRRPIRDLLLLLAVGSLTAFPYIILVPIFAAEVLGAGPEGLGLLLSAAGLGALVAALALAGRESLRGYGRLIGIAAAGAGLFLLLFSLSRHLWISAALLVPAGFCIMSQMTATNTLIQSMTPDRLRGRMMSFYTTIFMGVAPVGSLLAGALAEGIGAPLTVALGGVACSLAGVAFLSRLSGFKATARPLLEEARKLTPPLPEN